jgi:LysM repeat protein
MNKKRLVVVVLVLTLVVGVSSYFLFWRDSGVKVDSSEERYAQEALLSEDILDRDNRFDVAIDYYTVKEGDTLESIALAYDLNVNTLVWANDLDGQELVVGNELTILPMDGVLVEVRSGDTLQSIANEYSASAQEIADFNWLDAPFELEIGSKLFVPNGIK